MSIYQMVKVWEHQFDHPEQSIMLALADHANDEGASIKPGIERIAWKTGYSERNVRRIVNKLRDSGILKMTRSHGDGRPTEYKIDWLMATPKPPYKNSEPDNLSATYEKANRTSETSKPDKSSIANRTSETSKPDIAMSPEPSRTINRTVIETSYALEVQNVKVVPPTDEYYNACLECWHTYKRPEWINHKSLTKTDKGNLKQFADYYKKDALAALAAALTNLANEKWTANKSLSLSNLASNDKLIRAAETFAHNRGAVGQDATSNNIYNSIRDAVRRSYANHQAN